MKFWKLLGVLLVLAPGLTPLNAQTRAGEPGAAYINPSGTNWIPMLGLGSGGSATEPGRPIDLFCQNASLNWVPCSGSSSATAPNTPTWIVSSTCGGQSNCTQVYSDGKVVLDATSNSTTTITCSNSDCNFTSADVGKVIWGTTAGQNTSIACPYTTIASIPNANSVVVNSACTSSLAGTMGLYWGHDDGPTLAALDGTEGCAVVQMSTANTIIFTSQPFMVIQPSATTCNRALNSSTGAMQPAWVGSGFGASQAVLEMTPNFNWAGCQTISGASHPVCFGGVARSIANIQIYGSGLNSSSTMCTNATNKIVLSGWPTSTVLYGVDLAAICPGTSGLEGVEMNSYDESFDLGGAQNVGQIACEIASGQGEVMRSNDCINPNQGSTGYGLLCKGGQLYSLDNYPLQPVLVQGGCTLNSQGGNFQAGGTNPGLEVQSGGSFVGHEDTHQGFTVDSGGFASASNQNFQPFSGATLTVNGNFTDLGANYWATNQPTTGASGSWQASSSTTLLFGTCRGTATSSSTLGLYGLGQFSTQACTSTTVNQGQPYRSISRAGKASTLACNASHGGVSASSGVVTVLKNAVATSITCTFGTGTACEDNTHTDTPALGDVYSIQFTTQASEVLANVTCTLLGW